MGSDCISSWSLLIFLLRSTEGLYSAKLTYCTRPTCLSPLNKPRVIQCYPPQPRLSTFPTVLHLNIARWGNWRWVVYALWVGYQRCTTPDNYILLPYPTITHHISALIHLLHLPAILRWTKIMPKQSTNLGRHDHLRWNIPGQMSWGRENTPIVLCLKCYDIFP